MTQLSFNHVGDTYRDFTVTKVMPIKELHVNLVELIHNPTGAQVMYIGNDDPENLFCLSFQTIPKTSNGVAHILEHTVLCGSEKYPIKDPFFAMTRRSLNTFMNALTGSDFTCYPASSQVPKDFYNLLEVYLDAVFKPNLKELSFAQEGIRLEFNKLDDSTTPLQYKGIVFNEMKGALSNPGTRLVEHINEKLFPNITYGINSGGDPKVIPDLTYEELKQFHKTYYHPSRCLFFFYGNLPLQDNLDFITEHALKGVEKVSKLEPVPRQPRLKQPVYHTASYPIAPDEDPKEKTDIAFAWLTTHILNQDEVLALSVLEIVLMDTDASPLKMALLRSGLCKQAFAYAEAEISEIPFVIILKGCEPENADPAEKVIKETLKNLYEKGISPDLIESAIHQLEISRKEITGDSAPYGLSLFMRSALLKQHGGNPESGLMIHSLFEELRNKVNNPRYLPELIKKYFLDNTHSVRLVLTPSKDISAQENAEERKKLDAIEAKLTEKQKKDIIEKSLRLIALQEEQEHQNIDILPTVTLEDVPKNARDYPLTKEKHGNLEVFHHECFTNEIVYADLNFPLPEINEDQMVIVRLFSVCCTQMGCGGRNYAENLDYIQAHIGGVGISLALNTQAKQFTDMHPAFHIKGKSLYRKADKLFHLFNDMINGIDFKDIPRLKEVISKHFVGIQSSIPQNALRYAINLSSSGLNLPAKVTEDWYGLSYFFKLREIVKDLDNRIEDIASQLSKLQEKLLGLKGAHLILSCDKEMHDTLISNQFYGLQNLKSTPFTPWKPTYKVEKVPSQARPIGAQVAFTAHVFPSIPYSHPDTPALCIASYLFDNTTLHTRIREQGGAYGCGSSCNPMVGTFYFYTYRDPHIVNSLKVFQEAIDTILEGNFEERELEESKLEVVQLLDSPISPGSRADLAYSWYIEGKTYALRQAFRERLLSVTKEDVCQAVKKHIVPNYNKGSTVLFAGKELIDKENGVLKGLNLPTFPVESI
jgi:Zn-dependent M16 (insulinase) family peptidase